MRLHAGTSTAVGSVCGSLPPHGHSSMGAQTHQAAQNWKQSQYFKRPSLMNIADLFFKNSETIVILSQGNNLIVAAVYA